MNICDLVTDFFFRKHISLLFVKKTFLKNGEDGPVGDEIRNRGCRRVQGRSKRPLIEVEKTHFVCSLSNILLITKEIQIPAYEIGESW